MPFLGKSPSDGNHNVLLDAVSTADNTAGYALTKDSVVYTPISAQSLMVSLNGVTQAPIAAYTVSGNTITFASNLMATDVIDYIIAFEGPKINVDASNIGAGSLSTSMLADSAVTTAKIADSDVTTAKIVDNAVTNAKMADDAIGIAELSATGTASATTFLRGDNSWVAVGGAYNDWEVKTSGSPFTAAAKDQLLINSGSAYTVNLPAGADGNSIIICNAGAGTVTVSANGSEKINSSTDDGTLPEGNSVQLVYAGSTIGWFEI